MKRTLTDEARCRGEGMPWWYGVAYYDYAAQQAICYPMPVNWVVRSIMMLESAWIRLRWGAPLWISARDVLPRETGIKEQAFRRGRSAGYETGFRTGFETGRDDAFRIVNERVEMLVSGKRVEITGEQLQGECGLAHGKAPRKGEGDGVVDTGDDRRRRGGISDPDAPGWPEIEKAPGAMGPRGGGNLC